MRRIVQLLSLTVLFTLLFSGMAFADSENRFPKNIALPNGFRPEGVTVGKGGEFYVGSLADGAIYKGDLRTGQGAIFFAGQAGNVSVGLEYDERTGNLFVSGGPTGVARVIDTRTGALIATVTLSSGFINDVAVTKEAAFFTNSAKAELYRVELDKKGNPTGQVRTLALSGDWQQVAGFNANGIDATRKGDKLIVVNSTTGLLYTVDPNSGVAKVIDLGGATVTAGDGILLTNKYLYVVRNQLNQIAVIDLNKETTSGRIVNVISDPAFRVPTTIDRFGSRLYAVNARFDTAPTPATDYDVVQVGNVQMGEE